MVPSVALFGLPTRIAPGRDIPFVVDDNPDSAIGDYAGGGALSFARQSQPPFFAHVLDPAENTAVSDGQSNGVEFPIKLNAASDAVTVTFSYHSNFAEDCLRSVQRTVQGTAPHRAQPHFADDTGKELDEAEFAVRVSGNCAVGPRGQTMVRLRGYGRSRTLRLDDLCGRWLPRSVALPGMRVTPDDDTLLADAALVFKATKTRRYHMTVSFAGRVVARRLVKTTYEHHPATRVYEGTDAFINYCINDNKTIRSYHLRLYCIDPAFTLRDVDFTGE